MWVKCLLRLTHMFDRTGPNMQIFWYQFVSVRICMVPLRYVRIEFIQLLAEHLRMFDLGIGRVCLISLYDRWSTEYRCIFRSDDFSHMTPLTFFHYRVLIMAHILGKNNLYAWILNHDCMKKSCEKYWCKWIAREWLSCERFRNEHVRLATFLFFYF